MLNYNHLYYFHVVATMASVSKAATKLALSAGNVSEQIRSLERSLGGDLFDRTPAGMRLTELGRAVFAQSTVMFAAASKIPVGEDTREPVRRLIDVGISASASRSMASQFLTPILTRDEIRPVICSGPTQELVGKLRAGQIDLVISEEAIDGEWAKNTAIHRPALVVVTSPHRADKDWRAQPLVGYPADSPFRADCEQLLQFTEDSNIVAVTDDCYLMVEIAALGLASAVVPRSVAKFAVEHGRLAIVHALEVSTVTYYASRQSRSTWDHIEAVIKSLESYGSQNS